MEETIKDWNDIVCGNNYKVCFIEPYKDTETIIYGEIQSFHPSGKVVIFVEGKSNLYIIPHSFIKWMIPNGLSRQFKEKISEKKKSDILLRLEKCIREQLGYEDKIELNDKLVADLGADSLDIVELVMALEEEFEISIEDSEIEKYMPNPIIEDLLEIIKSKV